MPRITSRQHPVVRRLRQLASRPEPDVVLLDGPHLVADALAAGVAIDLVLADGRHIDLGARSRASGAAVYEGSSAVLDAASPVKTPTGIVAAARWKPRDLADVLDATGPIVGLVGVQDPGNVGSVIRSADALAAGGVLLLDGSADPGSWKCLRGAMGSTFRIPIARGLAHDAIALARSRRRQIVAAAATGGTPLETMPLDDAPVVLLGSEGAGLPADVAAAADRMMTIPMRAGIDSLNVSVTAALVLWEARRRQGALGTAGHRKAASS